MANFVFYSLLVSSALFTQVQAAQRPDIIRLPDHMPKKALTEAQRVSPARLSSIPITFMLPLRNREELESLIERMYDPTDELYGKYLSTEEFVERFAPTQEDYDEVTNYAKKIGMRVVGLHPNRLLLNVMGRGNAVEAAFQVRLHKYQLPNGRSFFAPSDNPAVPSSIASKIHGIVGLDNHTVRKNVHCKREALSQIESKAFPSGPNGGFAPGDLVKAYNLSGVSANGTNQVIAMFELAGYNASDINAYTTQFGLPPAKLTNILVDGGSQIGANVEVTIDIELALALAPESQIYVYEGPNSDQGVLDVYNRIATDNIAKQVSTSWGAGEDLSTPQFLQSENAIFMQMAAQGQTIYAAAGDDGAFDDYTQTGSRSVVVDDPASQPYVVGVGGTRLTVDANSGAYASESVWNDGLGKGAGGGGVSKIWPLPAWQSKVQTAVSKTNRNVPDVALNADADTGYAIFFDNQWQIYGGTSCAAPLWAAFTACVNQELETLQMPPLGFANPVLYTLGMGTSYTMDFHDVTMGNNLFYNAAVGYDNASGWGSFNGTNLFASLTKAAPNMDIVMKHNAPFQKGSVGNYHIIVSNVGKASTSGPVTVTIALPIGLSYQSFSGSGWNFTPSTMTFTQNNPLAVGMSYPTLSLNVDVAENAPYTVIPTATVSGGGAASSTSMNATTTRNP